MVLVKKEEHINQYVQNIQSLLLKKKHTLALAESCTGGLLSYWLTCFSGASQFFLGSVVSYSYLAKMKYLGVSSQILEEKGAVNEEVCYQMAEGVFKRLSSDWALSITGVAGPEKMKYDPPIGTVFVALLGPDYRQVKHLLIKAKNRQDIRYQCALFALDVLHFGIQ